jgi:hypothetical protein
VGRRAKDGSERLAVGGLSRAACGHPHRCRAGRRVRPRARHRASRPETRAGVARWIRRSDADRLGPCRLHGPWRAAQIRRTQSWDAPANARDGVLPCRHPGTDGTGADAAFRARHRPVDGHLSAGRNAVLCADGDISVLSGIPRARRRLGKGVPDSAPIGTCARSRDPGGIGEHLPRMSQGGSERTHGICTRVRPRASGLQERIGPTPEIGRPHE